MQSSPKPGGHAESSLGSAFTLSSDHWTIVLHVAEHSGECGCHEVTKDLKQNGSATTQTDASNG